MTRRRRGLAARLYRALIRALPGHLVSRHGAEMEAMFLESLDEAAVTGPAAAIAVWTAAALDVAQTAGRQFRLAYGRPARVGGSSQRQASMITSDIRAAWRSLIRQKFATGLAIGMLALGIAASVAVFTLVNGIFLRPFPVPEPDRLVYINERAPKWNLEYVGINYPDFDQWRKGQRLFEAIALHDSATFNLADGASVARVEGAFITSDFFDVLAVPPLVGRTFSAEEDRPRARSW